MNMLMDYITFNVNLALPQIGHLPLTQTVSTILFLVIFRAKKFLLHEAQTYCFRDTT